MKKKRVPVKAVILIVAAILLIYPTYRYLSFCAIIRDILHPDWEQVTLITSYSRTIDLYTEYTQDNGRALAEEALSHVRLGLPYVNLLALLGSGANNECVVVEIFTAEGSQRVSFILSRGASGLVYGEGEIMPSFFGGEKLAEMFGSPELVRKRNPSVYSYEYMYPTYR